MNESNFHNFLEVITCKLVGKYFTLYVSKEKKNSRKSKYESNKFQNSHMMHNFESCPSGKED